MRNLMLLLCCALAYGAFVLAVSALNGAAGYVVVGLFVLTWIAWRTLNRPT
jgi:high-affinity nickel permease